MSFTPLTLTPLVLTGVPQRTVFDLSSVKDWGARGDGTTDDYAAIMAAYTAIAATGGTLYFPPGRYRFNTALLFSNPSTRPISILGSGAATVLSPAFASGDAITLSASSGNTRVSVQNLHIEPLVTRDQASYNLSLISTINSTVMNVTMENSGGGLYLFDSCIFLKVDNCQGRSSTSAAGTALRVKACSGSARFSNSRFETANGATGYTGCKPAIHVTGTSTGLKFSNVDAVGAGPHSQYTVSGITSDAAKFTVTTTAAHDFRVGDFAVLRGMTPAGYNSQWRVATVPTGTTFTVTTTLNPGSSSVNGTAESVAACALVTNEDAGSALSVNESAFTGCLFEASQTGLYGSAALYFDGRRGTYPTGAQSGSLSGWALAGNYYDQYATGLLISGMASNAANETTTNGLSVSGGVSNARGRAIHLDQVQAITIGDFVGCVPGSVTPIDDGISAPIVTDSAGLYIYGVAALPTQGISVTNSQFGMGRNWQATNNTPYSRAILFDGASGSITDVAVTGCLLFGANVNGSVGQINGIGGDLTRRFKFKGNSHGSGTFPPTATTSVPQIASATNIAATGAYETVEITGTTNIQVIQGGWVGRELTLLFQGALTLLTGGGVAGPFAATANRTVLAGDAATIVFDGTSWYVR